MSNDDNGNPPESIAGSTPSRLPAWADELPDFPPSSDFLSWSLEDADPPDEPEPHPDVARLARVEDKLEYKFRDQRLLRCALTSTGWVNEGPYPFIGNWPDNKALEWLGDAVLYLVVTDRLVDSGDAKCTGDSTPLRMNLINNDKLAEVGDSLELRAALYLGKGERGANWAKGRVKYLSRAVEALVGAIYLDARAVAEPPLPTVTPVIRRLLHA